MILFLDRARGECTRTLRRAHLSVQNGLNEGWTVHSGWKPIQLYIGVEGKAWVEEKNKLEVGWNWRRYRDLWVLGAEGWPLWAEVAEVHSLRPCSYLPSFIGLRKSFLDSQKTSLKATQKKCFGARWLRFTASVFQRTYSRHTSLTLIIRKKGKLNSLWHSPVPSG